ncbi:sigma-70 family RNA polymerase sigma factor [Microbacterium sp. SSW1-49]|uniref:Sigma-70 family RNA polymerase sigma factor n=1 Tax=Microbacterium croceum TaxID=2851645 RepID=A0ABT0F9Q3_9MICO|nr:sigma-70 family RNA polymerase sigma factor [Microbacterium croceum]MCK2034785.1 sigma-70 family RNA polymerase sigma factor [Microbacterium croceum]
MSAGETPDSLSDQDLVQRVREQDSGAYAELWRRHAGPAYSVARTFDYLDADDIVSEAFARVLRSIKAGGGPTTGFRPYLIMAVRNVGRRWYVQETSIAVDDFEYVIDPAAPEGELSAVESFEGGAALEAFRGLPTRWQEVLWYSEVDGMKPRDISVLLGMAPNAVSALIVRAKRGLRDGWITAQLSGARTPECREALKGMGAHTRDGLSARARATLESHLSSCPTCPQALEEAKNLSNLTMSVLPAVAGVSGAAGYVSTLGPPPLSVAMASGAEALVSDAPAGTNASSRRRRLVLLALLLLLLALGAFGAYAALTSPSPSDAGAQPSTAQPAPSPGPAGSTPPASPSPGATPSPLPSPQVSSLPFLPGAEPSAAPGAGGAGRPDQGPPGQGETPSTPAAPGAAIAQLDSRMYPKVSGDDAAPRAVVEILDSGGATIANTVAGADGTWTAHLTSADAGTRSVTARQIVSGRTSPASAPLTYTLSSPPPAATPVSGTTVTATRFRFAFTAEAGTVLQRQIVGATPIQTIRVPRSGAWNEYLSVAPGSHSIRLRYANPATGDYGPWTTWNFTAE